MMKNKLVYLSVLFCTITLFFTNCTKAGLGGKSEIKGYAYYNNKTIKPTTFYIKYGATTSPGSDSVIFLTFFLLNQKEAITPRRDKLNRQIRFY